MVDTSSDARKSIVDWDENDVQSFLSKIGFSQYESNIREHRISGDILAILNVDDLKEIGITTIGQRLAILKHVYLAKVAHNIPIEPDHYVPPSEAEETQETVTLDKLHDLVKEQGERLRMVEEENRWLNETLQQCLQELSSASQGRPNDDRPLRKQPSFKWAQYVKPVRSPTKTETISQTDSPHPSPNKFEHEIPSRGPLPPPPPSQQYTSDRYRNPGNASGSSPDSATTTLAASSKQPPRQEGTNISTTDNLKSFKVSLDDPAWKVLPAALKKYKINNDDWQNYAMFICYGSTERCLSYDEKPLLLFQKLKDAKKNPVFMLKHIKDIRSPIAVAQQKHAARKASENTTSPSNRPTTTAPGRSMSRPSKLQVHGLAHGTPPLNTANGTGPAWPEVMSPAVEQKDKMDEFGAEAGRSRLVAAGMVSADESADISSGGSGREGAVTSTGVSYAVAIYPYMAEQEDEFDVVVGDTFVILSRARGWWVVQRDPAGTGVVETDTSKQGWVPAGCLLETNVPVASAVAEATAARSSATGSPPPSPASKTPILPLSILSTSFPGVALTDYRKKGEEELDLVKDDLLRVFKRYNHWSYAVKEDGGDRGWVPSWFIGKVSGAGGVPPTPSTTNPSSQMTLDPDFRYAASDSGSNLGGGGGSGGGGGVGQHQISPMSSAFPPVSRTATVV
ncbi:hypothetical protein BD410DRAFT_838533 [Rickenella mellea]|uniref:RA-domain-containing protein n=1 Tax=Rickenella mellea TaxID=50990 RepID=A0A4Y7Q8N4_9AGAM|nr:hypothetical protein BD410DRAFT_838533 [Rickenella mellea]